MSNGRVTKCVPTGSIPILNLPEQATSLLISHPLHRDEGRLGKHVCVSVFTKSTPTSRLCICRHHKYINYCNFTTEWFVSCPSSKIAKIVVRLTRGRVSICSQWI